jgi:hypothetical protein
VGSVSKASVMPTLCGSQCPSQHLAAPNLWINSPLFVPCSRIAQEIRRSQGAQRASQSSAPMLRVCSALRRASSTTSSENIWLYLWGSSTGFVRCNFDFSAAIVRITVSS